MNLDQNGINGLVKKSIAGIDNVLWQCSAIQYDPSFGANYNADSSSADESINLNLLQKRWLCQEFANNHPIGKCIVNSIKANIVGDGPKVSVNTSSKKYNKQLEKHIKRAWNVYRQT